MIIRLRNYHTCKRDLLSVNKLDLEVGNGANSKIGMALDELMSYVANRNKVLRRVFGSKRDGQLAGEKRA